MKSPSRRRLCCLFATLLVCYPITAPAQWDKKPAAEWSQKDAEKILNSSPWSQTQVFTEIVQGTTDVKRDAPIGQSRVPDDVRVNFRVRFLTARPIRLAAARFIELQSKGEMNEQRAASLKQFVDHSDPDNIVVAVVIDSAKPSDKFSQARSVLSKMNTGVLKTNTYLAVKDQRIFLKEYMPPGADGLGARFIFPRLVNGAPVILPDTGEIRFSADLPNGFALSQRFRTKDMMYEGKLEY